MLKEGVNGFCMALADSVPGVSGGTVAFIMGFYDRFIGSVHDIALPGLLFFVCGILAGALSIVKALKVCLERFRPQMMYLILGMMAGSFYTIIMGPTTLERPQPPLSLERFSAMACIVGMALVLGMQMLKESKRVLQQEQAEGVKQQKTA